MTHGVTATGISFPDGSVQTTASGYIGARRQIFTTSGTFTVPATVTAVKVTAISGGGAGGAAYASGQLKKATGSGGGSGNVDEMYITGLVPGTSINVTIGAGGTPNTGTTGTTGGSGGATSFGTYMTITGGVGGATNENSIYDGDLIPGGAAGVVQHTRQAIVNMGGTSGGDTSVNFNSGVGGNVYHPVYDSKGGGGVTIVGAGQTVGAAGTGYGAGGSGGAATVPSGGNSYNPIGGAGSSGLVVVEW